MIKDPSGKDDTILGLCDYDNKTIYISTEQKDKDMTDTLIHEMTHALFPHLSEKRVPEAAREISVALWAADMFKKKL